MNLRFGNFKKTDQEKLFDDAFRKYVEIATAMDHDGEYAEEIVSYEKGDDCKTYAIDTNGRKYEVVDEYSLLDIDYEKREQEILERVAAEFRSQISDICNEKDGEYSFKTSRTLIQRMRDIFKESPSIAA